MPLTITRSLLVPAPGTCILSDMSFIGRILAAAADQLWNGPLGPLLTTLTGEQKRPSANAEEDATLSVAFTIGVIALSAKMAKADGQVTPDEIRAFRDVFHFPEEDEADVGRAFDRARRSVDGFENYAQQLAEMFKDRRPVLQELLNCLFHIARADTVVHPDELSYLAKVAEIFGFSQAEFDRLCLVELSGSECDPYLVLELPCGAPYSDVQAAWRRLVRDVHPDRLIALGLPKERIDAAQERLIAINAAYEQITTQHRDRAAAGAPPDAEDPSP